LQLLKSHDQQHTPEDILEIRNQRALEVAEEPEFEPEERTVMGFWEGLKMEFICLKVLIGTSSEQQQLDRELWGDSCCEDMQKEKKRSSVCRISVLNFFRSALTF
jgi:hypothetical protein